MIHFEPLPLLEAHFFLAGKQAGFTAEDYFSKKSALNPPTEFSAERYVKLLSALEARLSAAVAVSDAELAALYGELGNGSGDPAFQGDYFAANLVIGGLDGLQDESSCFSGIHARLGEIPERIALRILGEAPEEAVTPMRAVELITGSELRGESKLLLIDLVLHPQKYVDMLEKALLPVAAEFRRCREFIEPLVAVFRRNYGHIESPEQENALLLPMLKPGSRAVARYDIYPLISYFYVIVFSFISADNSSVFGGIGVLYDTLKKYYRTDIDINAKLASIMNTLGSKSRFDILARLSEGPQYGRELAANLGLTPATVSHHINALLAEGLIKLDTSGKRIYYSLNYDCTEAFVENLQRLLSRRK